MAFVNEEEKRWSEVLYGNEDDKCGPGLYPGLGLPLRYNPQDCYNFYPIGAHGNCYESNSDMLPVRELAMMSIMEKLTDKDNWQEKIYDEEIVAKWRKEALAVSDEDWWKLAIEGKYQHWEDIGVTISDDSETFPAIVGSFMSEEAFDFCIDELKSKAKHYEKTGIIPTLDATAAVAKSDKLVSPELHDRLCKAFDRLKTDQSQNPDWHPKSNEMVQDLVHPSMYPLVYGRSRVFKDEVVGLSDAVGKWAGKGTVIDKDTWEPDNERGKLRSGIGSGYVPPTFWSQTYQWLPANVAFQPDGSVKFTSYINNLHPEKYPEIYEMVEKLIETSLPAWDQCLKMAISYEKRDGPGRYASRFPMVGVSDENASNWEPSGPEELADVAVDWDKQPRNAYNPNWGDENEAKWKLLRKAVIPEPSNVVTDYSIKPGKRLIDKYRHSGLQVIVKMASIELTPEKPEFPSGAWHVEGQMNEHICATALYYLDSTNITPSSLSFRMQVSAFIDEDMDEVGQDEFHWLEQTYGTALSGGCSPCLQNYGKVETKQRRLLAFPNVFQHRVSSFELDDKQKPGHRRFIALWLVDPTKRIISTANVPPQQQDWWLESLLSRDEKHKDKQPRETALSKIPPEVLQLFKEKGVDAGIPSEGEGTLPPELMEMVREYYNTDKNTMPMSAEEAKSHREMLMQERSTFHREAEDGWQKHSYNFCEH